MKIGMLWFDNTKKNVDEKVKAAISYYQSKYGNRPDQCVVHPSMVSNETTSLAGIEIKTSRSVQPNHFWIGLRER
jgi:hypothetical protein